MARTVKKNYSDIPLVIGGVHISLCPNMLPEWIDIGVCGEGEKTFLELVEAYQSEGRLENENIKGIVFKKNGNLVNTGTRNLIEPLDIIPHPDIEALYVPKKELSHIITSRGCPFKCKFCSSTKFWRKPRFHSAEYVVEEIEKAVNEYKRKKLMIYDDLFTMDKIRIERLAELMEERGLNEKIEFDIISHVDFLNEEIIANLKRMRVTRISLGMESGSKKILDYLKNGVVTHDKIRKAVALCKKNGIGAMGSFMIGSPYETEKDIRDTIDFIKEINLDEIGLNVTTPFPGTAIWEYAKEKRLIKGDEWDDRLWGMHHIDENNIREKIILADVDKEVFIRLYRQMHDLLLNIARRRELKNWLRQPFNLKLLMIHIKGRIKSFKKRFRAKLKKFAKVRLAEHMLPPHFEKVVSCGLCRSAEQKIIDEKGNILQCKKCGLKFMSPRPTQKDISKIYDWSYSNCLGWGRVKPEAQLMYERRFNFFKKFVNGGKILDIGAGLGIFLAKAKMTNRWQCFGTEISKYAVEFAKKEFDIELALGQLEDLAFPEKFFDAVCFWHVLEHLPHPSKAIKETARILKDDGFLFIAVPNDSWLGRRQFFKNAFKKAVNCLPIKKKLRLKKMYPEIDEEGNKHLLYFTPYTLKKFLEKYGFRIRKHSVDYDYEESNPKLERKYKFELLLCHLTGINFSNAILVAAQKK